MQLVMTGQNPILRNYGSEGCRFNSCWVRQLFYPLILRDAPSPEPTCFRPVLCSKSRQRLTQFAGGNNGKVQFILNPLIRRVI
jgi:hypothetical protein